MINDLAIVISGASGLPVSIDNQLPRNMNRTSTRHGVFFSESTLTTYQSSDLLLAYSGRLWPSKQPQGLSESRLEGGLIYRENVSDVRDSKASSLEGLRCFCMIEKSRSFLVAGLDRHDQCALSPWLRNFCRDNLEETFSAPLERFQAAAKHCRRTLPEVRLSKYYANDRTRAKSADGKVARELDQCVSQIAQTSTGGHRESDLRRKGGASSQRRSGQYYTGLCSAGSGSQN